MKISISINNIADAYNWAFILCNRLLQQRCSNRLQSVNGLERGCTTGLRVGCCRLQELNLFNSCNRQQPTRNNVNALATRLYNRLHNRAVSLTNHRRPMRDVTPSLRHIVHHNMASVKLWSEADCNRLTDDDSGYHCSRRRCRRLRRLLIIIATAAAAVAATNQLTKSSSSSSCIVLPENTNKNGATADGNNVSDVIMAWRGRGTHRLYNVVVQPVVTTGCNNRLHSVNAA